MKQEIRTLRRAAALLLAAAAFPFTPLAAQETQTQPTPEPFAVEVPAPPVTPPVQATIPEPEATAPAAAVSEPAPAAAAPARRSAPARTAARSAPARAAAPARQAQSAPAPVADAAPPAAAAAPAALPAEAVPAAVELPPVAATPPAAEPARGPGFNPLWLVLGALALGALAIAFLMRRRRRAAAYEDAPVVAEPVEPAAAAPVMAAAAPVEEGRPELDLALRPVRAGVTGTDAVVEFELDVDNRGSAAARDVRVSTWMLAAGGSEAESALIDRGDGEALPAIAAGAAGHLTSSVTLPTASVESDAVLPLVVAEARYRLPDGSEARTSATYAVGVPDGEELAHFAIDNPSGLHDEVVAWKMGETENA